MTTIRRPAAIPLALAAALALPALAVLATAQDASVGRDPAPDFAALEAAQNAANAKAGPRTVPGRSIPVPTTASEQLQASIAAPYRVPTWTPTPRAPRSGKR